MYKSSSRSTHYLARSGSYSTHGGRRGSVDIVPREPKHEWHPELFAGYYALAQFCIIESKKDGHKFRDGADAAAAFAASEHLLRSRAMDAMRAMLKAMTL